MGSESQRLLNMLDNLTESEYERFRHGLLHRDAEPRVRRNQVENKSRVEITDVLISTFTRMNAIRVAEEVLRVINCHQAADDLVNNDMDLL